MIDFSGQGFVDFNSDSFNESGDMRAFSAK
jgi:hypothetical protein